MVVDSPLVNVMSNSTAQKLLEAQSKNSEVLGRVASRQY